MKTISPLKHFITQRVLSAQLDTRKSRHLNIKNEKNVISPIVIIPREIHHWKKPLLKHLLYENVWPGKVYKKPWGVGVVRWHVKGESQEKPEKTP